MSDESEQTPCPEAADVTVTNVNVTMNGAAVHPVNEYITTADTGSYNSVGPVVQLSEYPIHPESVRLAVNGVLQGEHTSGNAYNFSVNGQYVSLNFTPSSGDVMHFMYDAYAGSVADGSGFVVGDMKVHPGTNSQAGWLSCNGTTSYLAADYPAAYAHAVANSLYESIVAGVSFILKSFDVTINSVVMRYLMKA